MTKAHNTFSAKDAHRFPVYCKYAGQIFPQPAFIELDIETGAVNADYSGEIGNAVPASVFHGTVLRFDIPAESTADAIESYIEANLETFQAICDGASVEWDGSNYVGQFTDDAQKAIDILDNWDGDESIGSSIIDDIGQWLDGDVFPEADQSVEDYAQKLVEWDGENDCYFYEEPTVDSILSMLTDVWAEQLYSGEELPQQVAQYLVKCGECDDSEWKEELAAMANGTYTE